MSLDSEVQKEGKVTEAEKSRATDGRRHARCSAGTVMGDQARGQQWVVLFLIVLVAQSPGGAAVGVFELQILQVQNLRGLLQSGECCDLLATGGQRCSTADQCDTFFRACLKEYQVRVTATGACTFGSGSTGVLGGNTFSLHHHGDGGGAGEEAGDGRIIIPFKYAWPKSFSLVLEALDQDNDTMELGSGQLIGQVLLSSMLNPGPQWQILWHHGRQLSLEYGLRFRCGENYYGPRCSHLCRTRDDFFGHFTCDPVGGKDCLGGWEGPECRQAICRQGCHPTHGYCSLPGECECQYGWQGALCDQCVTFPGCVHGSCFQPWQCVCDTNWGGLLCDKDLNYCGTHQPCKNGGTCTNTEPNEYQCTCREGFRGRVCDIVEHACMSAPCRNGGSCTENASGFSCVCADDWTGLTCTSAVQKCLARPCAQGTTCLDVEAGFECLCPQGWTGKACEQDINECEAGLCVNALACHDLIGGYSCDCQAGWTGQNCDIRNMSCQGKCLNGGHCVESVSGFHCQCLLGFSGKNCQTEPGICDSAPCLHGGQCLEMGEGSMLCHCPPGYTGAHCEVLMDPCKHTPCQKGAPCVSVEDHSPVSALGASLMEIAQISWIPVRESAAKVTCLEGVLFGALGDSAQAVLLFMLVMVTAGGCAGLVLLLSRLCAHHNKRLPQGAPLDQAGNNQRECVMLEEIELTLPPADLKPAPLPKLDLCNTEREKLNRFRCQSADTEGLERALSWHAEDRNVLLSPLTPPFVTGSEDIHEIRWSKPPHSERAQRCPCGFPLSDPSAPLSNTQRDSTAASVSASREAPQRPGCVVPDSPRTRWC
ncbi:hypothetical protein AGOR_G00031210 [Albula goreensis]|uniref:Delta-like protein n=1 Tax=Albula goreensis TaxID=1534307 RepID=A0A8T3E829_9TELE|nr:hypothetical protein AGOR_G00031210 [Albula goreensis]